MDCTIIIETLCFSLQIEPDRYGRNFYRSSLEDFHQGYGLPWLGWLIRTGLILHETTEFVSFLFERWKVLRVNRESHLKRELDFFLGRNDDLKTERRRRPPGGVSCGPLLLRRDLLGGGCGNLRGPFLI
ncbi:MAG: hypothetical protein WDO73_26585 [Ignavibacteriota bacterium]